MVDRMRNTNIVAESPIPGKSFAAAAKKNAIYKKDELAS